jgi:hypothetical protein
MAPLVHDSYKDFSAYLRKLDKYTDWGAEDLRGKGRRASVLHLLVKPPARFVRMYVLQLGVLDGVRGLIVCTLGATSVFLKYSKLWRLSARRGDR